MIPRFATVSRTTKETKISVSVDLGGGPVTVSTGLPFFDHMLDQLGRHGGFGLAVEAVGDLHVDGHHTVEDTGIAVGDAFRQALGDKAGVARFASGLFPLDEALIEVALDLSGRPFAVPVGRAVRRGAAAGVASVQPRDGRPLLAVVRHRGGHHPARHQAAGDNTHHVIEAAFKGVSRCLRAAVRVEGEDLPSTKGVL